MKILVFSDLHGSLNGLKALMATDDYLTADKVIFLGDVTFACSRPDECIKLLNNSNITCLLGNNDRYIINNHIAEKEMHTFDAGKHKQMEYMLENTSQESKDIMNSWLLDLSMNINNKEFYFVHYPWLDIDSDPYAAPCPTEPSIEALKALFKDITADYIIFGHEHRSYHIIDNITHYICIDTVSLKIPGHYIIINTNNDDIQIEDRYLNYDIQEEILLMDEAGYPYNKTKIGMKKSSN